MRNVPKAQRPTRLHDFFVRQSGNLLSENTKLWSDNPLSVGNVGKLTRQSKKIQQRLIEVHFDPVSKKYGAGSQEALEAWTQIAAWNNKANERVLETLKKHTLKDASERTMNRFNALRNKLMMQGRPGSKIKREQRKRLVE